MRKNAGQDAPLIFVALSLFWPCRFTPPFRSFKLRSSVFAFSSSAQHFMPRRIIAVQFMILTLSVTAAAQTAVDGIIHGLSGTAVSGASVTLLRSEGNMAQHTNTDAAGRVRFPAVEA